MTGLRKKSRIHRLRGVQPRIVSNNVAAIRGEDLIQSAFFDVGLRSLNTRKRVMQAGKLDATSSSPKHGQFNSALDGQYLHVTAPNRGSQPGPIPVRVPHDLGRVPQGIIWIIQPTAPSILIMNAEAKNIVSGGLKISDRHNAYFLMAGKEGEKAIALIF